MKVRLNNRSENVLKILRDVLTVISENDCHGMKTVGGTKINNQEITKRLDLSSHLGFLPTCSELILQFEMPVAQNPVFGIRLSNALGEEYVIGFDASKNQFFSDRTRAGKTAFSEKFAATQHIATRFSSDRRVEMHLIFDRASCELLADNGSVAMTDLFFPNQDFSKMEIFSEQGAVQIKSGKVWKLSGPAVSR